MTGQKTNRFRNRNWNCNSRPKRKRSKLARIDSRTILDAMGADKLLGKGDMLYLPPGSARLIRAQGALITDQEIQNIVDFIAKQGEPSYEMEIHQQLSQPAAAIGEESGTDEDESLIEQCIEV